MSGPRHIVVMGVSANGKSTVGQGLADRLGAVFIEGDDLHPQSNIDKMAAGTALTDADRQPWLEAIAEVTAQHVRRGESTVVACSALRRRYRDTLREATPETFFVHLHGTFALLAERIRARQDHFMPPGLLQSQFETLEPLGDDELGALIDVTPPPAEVVATALAEILRSDQAFGSAPP